METFLKEEKKYYHLLKNIMDSYYPLEDNTWDSFKQFLKIKYIKKGDIIFNRYDVPHSFYFVVNGLLRAFTNNEKGEEYNKMFFCEGRFFGPMASLLTNKPIIFSVEALEDCILFSIDFIKFRELLYKEEDLKLFHILYLEKHWIIEKKESEYSLVLEDASIRYERFKEEFSHIIQRLSQYHIANHLGITPTHLSRIRKKLENTK